MPKTIVGTKERQNRITRGILEKYRANHGYSKKDMAIKLGISQSQYDRRIKDPSKLTIEEARHIVPGMSEADALELYGV